MISRPRTFVGGKMIEKRRAQQETVEQTPEKGWRVDLASMGDVAAVEGNDMGNVRVQET